MSTCIQNQDQSRKTEIKELLIGRHVITTPGHFQNYSKILRMFCILFFQCWRAVIWASLLVSEDAFSPGWYTIKHWGQHNNFADTALIKSCVLLVGILHRLLSLIQHSSLSFWKTSGRTKVPPNSWIEASEAKVLWDHKHRQWIPPVSPSLTIKGMQLCVLKISIKKIYEFLWGGKQHHQHPFKPTRSKIEIKWLSKPCIDLDIYYHKVVIDSTQYHSSL